MREANPKAEGNIRDHATIEQLVVLSNMESINAVLIHQQLNQSERLLQLNKIAITQMKTLLNSSVMKKIKIENEFIFLQHHQPFESATELFGLLNIKLNSNTTEPLPVRDLLKQHFKETEIFNSIEKTFYIGTLDNTVLGATVPPERDYKQAVEQADKNYEGLMLFALQLNKQPTRTEISELTRAFNRISQKMPVSLVLKYQVQNEAVISICISERFKYLQDWRQGEKAGKVIILRDIHTQTTHTGHLRILQDLVKPVGVTNYAQLHEHWLQVLDVSILNKKFYEELFKWYLWAVKNVEFPQIRPKEDLIPDEAHQSESVIRLLTRLLFCWFMKEKQQLIPEILFDENEAKRILKDFSTDKKKNSVYYRAVLQNLFFCNAECSNQRQKISS